MMGAIEGSDLSVFSDRRLVRTAAIGALVAALALAGCGRKGGLDLPPEASLADPGTPPGAPPPAAAPELGPDGRPVAPAPPPAPRRWTPLDFLID
jgi:predicted small lipoprotein YifL